MIRVMIVDDHAVVRSGLAMLIDSQNDMETVGTARDGIEAVRLALVLCPDVILMDLSMTTGGSGISATMRLGALLPDAKVIILTMHDDGEYMKQAMQAGAAGYVLKSEDDVQLMDAIRGVYNGTSQPYESCLPTQSEPLTIKDCVLTSREHEVLILIAKGFTNKEIGEKLYVSVKTVEVHKARIMEKMEFTSRHQLVSYAFRNGLVEFEME